jgi:hypothetical protein
MISYDIDRHEVRALDTTLRLQFSPNGVSARVWHTTSETEWK